MSERGGVWGVLAFVAALLIGAEVAYASCISAADREAYEVYALRTQVLVGAQSCRLTERFNAFATRFDGELTTEGRALRGYYQKTYGKKGDSALDDFVTRLANMTAVAGSGSSNYCTTTAALLDEIMAVPVGQLAVFSRRNQPSALPAMDVCGKAPLTANSQP